jgi:hypothetical protein
LHLFHMHLDVHIHWCLKYNLFCKTYCAMFGHYNWSYEKHYETSKTPSSKYVQPLLSSVLLSYKLKWWFICLFQWLVDLKCLYHHINLLLQKILFTSM